MDGSFPTHPLTCPDRVSPMTYMVSGWTATGLHGRIVRCAQNELAIFDPPSGQTCQQYLADYLQSGAPGQLYNPSATSQCHYCPLTSADQFLAASNVYCESLTKPETGTTGALRNASWLERTTASRGSSVQPLVTARDSFCTRLPPPLSPLLSNRSTIREANAMQGARDGGILELAGLLSFST